MEQTVDDCYILCILHGPTYQLLNIPPFYRPQYGPADLSCVEKVHVPDLNELDAMLEPESKDGLEFKSQPQPDKESRWWEQLRKNLAGSGVLLEKCVDTVLSMYSILRECGKAEKDELLNAVDVDATEYASCDSVWSNMVKGKDTLSALSGVKTPPTGGTTWRYNNG